MTICTLLNARSAWLAYERCHGIGHAPHSSAAEDFPTRRGQLLFRNQNQVDVLDAQQKCSRLCYCGRIGIRRRLVLSNFFAIFINRVARNPVIIKIFGCTGPNYIPKEDYLISNSHSLGTETEKEKSERLVILASSTQRQQKIRQNQLKVVSSHYDRSALKTMLDLIKQLRSIRKYPASLAGSLFFCFDLGHKQALTGSVIDDFLAFPYRKSGVPFSKIVAKSDLERLERHDEFFGVHIVREVTGNWSDKAFAPSRTDELDSIRQPTYLASKSSGAFAVGKVISNRQKMSGAQ